MNKEERFVILFCLVFVCAIFILVNVVSAEITGKAIASTSSPRVSSLSKSAVATSPAGVAASSVKKAVSSSGNSASSAKLSKIVDYRGYKYFADDSGKRSNIYSTIKGIIYLQRPSFGGVVTDYFWPDKKLGNVTAAPAGNFINLDASAEKTIGINSFNQLNGMKIDDNGNIVETPKSKELKVAGANGDEISTGMTVDGLGYIHPKNNPSETIGIMDKNGKITMYDPSTYSAATAASLGSVANLVQNTQAKNGVISSLTPVKTGGYANASTITNPSLIVAKPVTTPPVITKPAVITPTPPSTTCTGLCYSQYNAPTIQELKTTDTMSANLKSCLSRCTGSSTNPGTTSPGTSPSYPLTSPGTPSPSYPGTSPSRPGTTNPPASNPGTKPGISRPGTSSPGTMTNPGTKPGTKTPPMGTNPGTTTTGVEGDEISCLNNLGACTDKKPICEPTRKVCVACMNGEGDICDPGQKCSNNICVTGCVDDNNCPTSASSCDPVKKICVASGTDGGCNDDFDCDLGYICNNFIDSNKLGNCIEGCIYDFFCPNDKPVCDFTNGINEIVGKCVVGEGKCISDSECTSEDAARCDLSTGKCVSCTSDISDSSCKKFKGTVCYQGKCAEGCGGVSRLLPIGAYDLSVDGTTCYKCNGGDDYEKVDDAQCAKSACNSPPRIKATTSTQKSMIFSLIAPFTKFVSTITGNVVDEEVNSGESETSLTETSGDSCPMYGECSDANCYEAYGPDGDGSGYTICDDSDSTNIGCVLDENYLGCDAEFYGNYMCSFGEVCLDDGSCTKGCDTNEDCDQNSDEPICDSTLGDYGECVGCSVEEGCVDGGTCNEDGSCSSGCQTSDDCPNFGMYCNIPTGVCEAGCEEVSSSAWGNDCLDGFICDTSYGSPGECVEDNGENGYCGDGVCDWDSENEMYEDSIGCPNDCQCYSDEECDWYQTCSSSGSCEYGECNQDNGASDYCISNYGSEYTCNEYTGSCEYNEGDEGYCGDGVCSEYEWDYELNNAWCAEDCDRLYCEIYPNDEYCSGNSEDGSTDGGSECIDECDGAYVEYECEDGSESGECYDGGDGCYYWIDYTCYSD